MGGERGPQTILSKTDAKSVGDVIFMDDRSPKKDSRHVAVQERRYCVRYPFAADVVVLDLERGAQVDGVTSDLSIGGVLVCTSNPLPCNTPVRITLTRKDQKVEALGMIRVVKPRVGMGVEFIDVESPYDEVLRRWLDQLSRTR